MAAVVPNGTHETTSKRPVRTGTAPPGTHFVRMDLHAPAEADLLVAQRTACGWYPEKIPLWRHQMDIGEKHLFWIALPVSSPHLASLPPDSARVPIDRLGGKEATDEPLVPVGHVALDLTDDGYAIPRASLASRDATVVSVAGLFILRAFAGLGLAAFAMDEVEAFAARTYPQCHTVTLNVVCKRYYDVDAPDPLPPLEAPSEAFENRAYFRMMGWPEPEGKWAIETWYERRGFVKYDEVIRYTYENPATGWTHPIKVSLMKKPIKRLHTPTTKLAEVN